jgi:hypothetical protein
LCEEGYKGEELRGVTVFMWIMCAGNGVTGCTRGDCISLRHDQCPNDRACYDSTCVGKPNSIKENTEQSILQTPVVQHSAEEDRAATQQPTVEVWTIRQNAPVLQVLRGSQEQEELAEGPQAKDQLEMEVDAVRADQEMDQVVDPCVILTHVDRGQNATLDLTGQVKQDLSALARENNLN